MMHYGMCLMSELQLRPLLDEDGRWMMFGTCSVFEDQVMSQMCRSVVLTLLLCFLRFCSRLQGCDECVTHPDESS